MHRQGHRRDGGGPIALRAAGRPLRRSWWWLLALLLIALATLFLLRPGVGREAGLTVFAAASMRGTLPEHRALVGIQPGDTDWGDQCTPPVEKAIGEACDAIQNMASAWMQTEAVA